MMMTNSPSIQDVLFFPQMKPEAKQQVDGPEAFAARGVREELLPLFEKMGINTVAQIDEANVNKLFNDICGMRKKMKLDISNPSLDEVKGWQESV